MLIVPAVKVQQFSQELYLLNLSATDVERMVRFEVLGQEGLHGKSKARPRASRGARVNWGEIETRVQTSEQAYQRPILRKKVEELAQHYVQCREDGAVPAIPGAVLLTTDDAVTFSPQGGNPFVGLVSLPDADGSLRVLDGQHRLLALAALLGSPTLSDADRGAVRLLQVPAILFAGLPPPTIVEMFITINSKHTRLNPSLLFSLKGRQLYGDALDADVHEAIRKLNEAESSPLRGQIKMLGVGPGRVAQAGLATELRQAFQALQGTLTKDAFEDFTEHAARFYLVYFKEASRCFGDAWTSKRHSVISVIALRAFLQASPPVVQAVYGQGGDPRETVRQMLAPWSVRIGSERFETAGQWRTKIAGGGKETTRALARELMAALGEVK